jgi:probable FeS assembly SUF system protein SufT
LGKAAPALPELPEGATEDDLEKAVWQQLRTCFDPEIPINVVELGLIYECNLARQDDGEYRVDIKMTLTAPGCGMGETLADEVRSKVELIPTVAEADVDLVFDPPWSQHMMSEAARLETGMF